MRYMLLIALVLAGTAFVVWAIPNGSEAAKPLWYEQVEYPADASETERQVIERAIGAFAQQCPGIQRFAGDMGLVGVAVENGAITWEREYGWPVRVVLHFKVSDAPSAIPQNFRATGHHVRYSLGAGNVPGISAGKRVGERLCDGSAAAEWQNGIKPVPAMQLIDALSDG